MSAFRVVTFLAVGLVFGSFLTVVIHRVPRKESLVRPRSRCPRCGREIRARENVPILSYLLLRGRCRGCGLPISVEYPLVEAATAGLFVAAGLLVEPVEAAAVVAPFLGILLGVAVIDARYRVIPNRVTYPAFAVFAVAIAAVHLAGGGVDALRGLAGAALYAGPLFLLALAMPGGMGMGDVKLAAVMGLVLGSLGLARVAVAAGAGILLGGIGAVVAMAAFGMGRRAQMPYGPFLAGGGVVAALAGPQIAGAYLALF